MKIRPLQDRVIVKRLEEEEKTKGESSFPIRPKRSPWKGMVIAVGKGKTAEDGKADQTRCQGGRPHPFQQVCGHRSKDRRRRASDHARGRYSRNHREIIN